MEEFAEGRRKEFIGRLARRRWEGGGRESPEWGRGSQEDSPHGLTPTAQRILHSLTTCTAPSDLPLLHSQILHNNLHLDTHVAAAFISASSRLRRLRPALLLFSSLRRPHIFLCNTLMRALQHSSSHSTPHPLLIYIHTRRLSVPPNKYTFPILLKSLSDLPSALSLHADTIRVGLGHDLYVSNSLLNLYSACGNIPAAEQLFDEMPVREVISWTTMITAYRNSGMVSESLIAFERMQFAGVAPNRVTMVSALAACAAHGALDMGVWIHDQIRRSGWELDVVLGTSLVDMYGKCGRVDDGIGVFKGMRERNVFTWNAVIRALGLAKSGEEALRWFFVMEKEGIAPDGVTMIGVLSACSHSGLVEEGRRLFHCLMSGKYGFYPSIKHYACMVDLLGRAGLLDSAIEFIEQMPFQPNVAIWGSLLGASRAHRNSRLSEISAMRLVELEPENVAHYVLLSNLYVEMGRWRDAEEVRGLMKQMGLRKDAGLTFARSNEAEDYLEMVV